VSNGGPLEGDASPRRRPPLRTLLRFLALPLLVGAGFAALRWTPLAAYVSESALAATFARLSQAWWAPALLIGAYVVLSPLGVPATPLMFAGGVAFGAINGSIWNVTGVFLGGASTFFLGRVLGRDLVSHLAGGRLRRAERAIARRGFWSLVAVRFVPIPFALVNYGAALAGLRPALFLLTTAIGITPTVTIWTVFFAAVAHAASQKRTEMAVQLGISIVLLAAVILIPQLLQRRKRQSRLAALRADRRQRARRGASTV
jgi:uncharacterized membrane protein YdjX (TVP38/TMEM64 family)